MNLPDLAIRRPVFITCIFLLTVVLGIQSMGKLGVDLFPNITLPIILINTPYPGAGPNEIETLVTKPMEDNLSTISGIKTLSSVNKEGISTIIFEFTLDTDIKYAEQQIRDRIATIRNKLPTDILEPVIRNIDPADMPVLTLALSAKLKPAELFDLADQEIRPLIEQVKNVGFVDVQGGRKREIQVLLDVNKLKEKNITATQVVGRLAASGHNVPAGKLDYGDKEADIRTLGEFGNLGVIGSTLVSFYGNETPIRISDIGEVRDYLEDEKSRTSISGETALTLSVYRRSGINTISVVDAVKKRVGKINDSFKKRMPEFQLTVVRDSGKPIRANVNDVSDSIKLGIILTIIVVFFFLGSGRSTIITGLALPNSLLGAFVLMSVAGFTINIMTLLAMSLAVGLLIDDAIVVRENIFRHIELGKSPREAASFGTREVTLAVIATTTTVIAVFGPVAFLDGIVGQFFKEFGLTICFAMAISLLDALTMAPMLSAYFAGTLHAQRTNILTKASGAMVDAFNSFQDWLERRYVATLGFTLKHPLFVLFGALVIFLASFVAFKNVPKTFVPSSDTGEFIVALDMAPGTALDGIGKVATEIESKLRTHKEVNQTVLTVGGMNGEPNEATVFVQLVPSKDRTMNTSQFKEIARTIVKPYDFAKPKVQDVSGIGGQQQPFLVNITGPELGEIEKVALALYEKIKHHPDLKDVDISYRPGKPELRVIIDKARAEQLGVSSTIIGQELRTLIEGVVVAQFREAGREYDIRVRLREEQRNLKENFQKTLVPNINNRLVRLADVARLVETEGPSTIYRQNRGRYIQVSAGLAPNGRGGMGKAIEDIKRILGTEIPLPPGVRFDFVGQAESFQDLANSMLLAAGLATLFIFFVLASLYESFITPLAIMLVLPLAVCGAFYALAFTGASFDIFSMIGCIMLLGIATKNSILLVDYTNQLMGRGTEMRQAIVEAGKTRLRPILMTSIALIAGMLPVAIGLNEASKQRTSMGISVIGGLISSTLLTLVVVPAAYAYIEALRKWLTRLFLRIAA